MVIIKNPVEYIDETYVPDDFVIKDPSKMKWDELRSLCGHWRSWQKKSLPVFRFKSAMKNHMREDYTVTRCHGSAPAYVEIDEPESSRMAQVRAKKASAFEQAAEASDTESDMDETSSEGEG